MNDFTAFLRSLGLRPGTIAPDGKWRRCATESKPKKRNGAYKLLPGGAMGFAQDWESMSEPATWRPDKQSVPDFDRAAFRRHQQEAREQQRKAIVAARGFYAGCRPLRGGHPYLDAHGLSMRGCEGLRVDDDGWLVVPCYRGRDVTSLQRIAPDGTKRFWPGAPVAGTTYTIERPSATLTVLCEGLATGLAIYAAAPISRVVVTWNTGNMTRLEMQLQGLAVIAADNDHGTAEKIGTNPGIEAARKAAERLGCGVCWPEDVRGTDWADLRSERIAERKEMARKYETEAQIRRDVDSHIRSELLRAAKFVARGAA